MPRNTDPQPAFTLVPGLSVSIQVPIEHVEEVLAAIAALTPLKWGDYDNVSFITQPGTQRFRSLGGGQNTPTDGVAEVPCAELSFALPEDESLLARVLDAVFHAHPYEEPVIRIIPARFTRHIPGAGADSPHKFWNRETPGWVPPEHR